MIINSSSSLRVFLAGAHTTSPLVVSGEYVPISSMTASDGVAFDAQTNGTTPVTLVSSPGSGIRNVTRILIFNSDTATATITIARRVSGTDYVQATISLLSGYTAEWRPEIGWRIVDGQGQFLQTGSIGGSSHASTHNPGGVDALATAAAGAINVGDTAAEGTATSLARSDHVHSLDSDVPLSTGTSNAEGSASTVARSDHVHALSAHAASHENGGSDEIDVTGLSGLLADPQTPATHAASHQHGGADEVATATPAANAIPKAGAGGKLSSGWLAIGTDVQAYDATLDSLSALGTTADRIAYTTGVNTWAEAAITSFARTLLDDSSAAAARTTLGLDALAVLATVGTAQIDAGAVTLAKIANIADRRVLGRYDGSSGAPRELTPDEVRELIGEAAARVFDFTSSGTISLPSGCTGNEWCRATLRGPGGPGGSGARYAAGSGAGGGGGGGAGGMGVWEGVLSDLVGLTLTLGALGTPGAAVGDSTAGADGTTGTDSSLGSIMFASAGIRGRGGTTSAGGAGGNAGSPSPSPGGAGGTGGTGNATAGGSEAGGGGGGINTSNTVGGGREGGRSLTGSAGGIAGASAGDDGADGDALGSGGGGGKGSTTADAGDGGDGVGPGAGGGGGAGGRNGYGGGAAGQGGPAHLRIVVYT